jgi:hypothetical protein
MHYIFIHIKVVFEGTLYNLRGLGATRFVALAGGTLLGEATADLQFH